MKKGIMIVLEGIDGSGKTTQRDLIDEWFRKHGIVPVITREPGGTPMAQEIREVILKPREEPVCGRTEALLFYAARVQHLHNVILPALEAGKVVICDRFYHSTYAYQAVSRGIGFDQLDKIHEFAVGDFQPDHVFYYTIDPAVARARLAMRGGADRLEREDIEFFDRCQEAFQNLMEREDEDGPRWEMIHASMDEDQVFNQCVPTLLTIVNQIKARPTAKE